MRICIERVNHSMIGNPLLLQIQARLLIGETAQGKRLDGLQVTLPVAQLRPIRDALNGLTTCHHEHYILAGRCFLLIDNRTQETVQQPGRNIICYTIKGIEEEDHEPLMPGKGGKESEPIISNAV